MNLERQTFLKESFETRTFVADTTFINFCAEHGILIKRSLIPWRMTKPILGQIHGLPNSRGTLKATNGCECFILQQTPDGDQIFRGHLAWFVADVAESVDVETRQEIRTARRKVEKPEPRDTQLRKALEFLDY